MAPADLRVIFEDSLLLAVDKPAGQAVIPGRGLAEEPLNLQAGHKLGSKAFVVHRLDRGASGLVLFAKDAEGHRRLCGLFEGRRMHKLYLALVLGSLEKDGLIDRPMRPFGSGRMGVAAQGKPCLTRYRVLARAARSSLIEAAPETGRRHQLRVHLYSLGHPILGDPLYGAARPVDGAPRLMLHAWRLEFELQGRLYRLCTEPGLDFRSVLDRYGLGEIGPFSPQA